MIGARDVQICRGRAVVVDGVSLTVAGGEVVALVGPNGAGKSSLILGMGGELPVRSGEITLAGRPLGTWRAAERARRVIHLPQAPEAALGLSAADVVALGLEIAHGHAPAGVVARALRAVGLDDRARQPVATLSGGQRQRAHLARVIAQAEVAQTPQVVLLDEPTSAQDPGRAGLVLGWMRALAGRGHAVVVVLHDLGAAAGVADRVVLLAEGRRIEEGPPADVLSVDRLRAVYGPSLVAGRCPHTGCTWVVPRPQEVV